MNGSRRRLTIHGDLAAIKDALASAIIRDGGYDRDGFPFDQGYIVNRAIAQAIESRQPFEMRVWDGCPHLRALCDAHGLRMEIAEPLERAG